MNNTLSILLAALILGLLAVDYLLFDWAYAIFLSRKFLDLVTWVAFWR